MKSRPPRRRVRDRPVRRCALLTLCLLLAAACAARRGHAPEAEGGAGGLPRAAPGYVQWLERQSMLGTASRYTALVSGTDVFLRAPSVFSGDRTDTLLEAADVWLHIHPFTLLTSHMRPVWAELAAAGEIIDGLGLRGVYVAPTGESGGLWERDHTRSKTGEDVVALDFAPQMGAEAQFEAFADMAAQKQWQLGADILPPATGLGPDFFLAARNVREYAGLYMMFEAPEALWPLLPKVSSPWETARVPDAAPLADKGLLPPSLARDGLPWATPGGWAATGEVRGVDGRLRRWVYRGHGPAELPVLSWDDPSGGARKALSASVIRQIGVLRHTLAGIHMEPLAGLDAAAAPGASVTLEPGPSALRQMAREVRRYGGWSVQLDPLPPAMAAEMQREEVDFVADSVVSPAAEYALLTGEARLLREALAASRALGADQRRILRRLSSPDGMDLRGLDGPAPAAVRARLEKTPEWKGLLDENDGLRLYATAPTLAALAAGVSPQAAARPEGEEAIRRRHLLLTLFKAGLPGLLFVGGQDVAGALSLSDGPAALRSRGAWGLSAASAADTVNRQGAPRAPAAYAPLERQLRTPGSYADVLRRAAAVRRRHGLARAVMTAAADVAQPGSVGVFTRLPASVGGGTLLLLANFSDVPVKEYVPLPGETRGRVRDILQAKDEGEASGGLAASLAPLECRWLVIGGDGEREKDYMLPAGDDGHTIRHE